MNESLHTLFLAQVIGLYLFIMAIVMLSRIDYYRNILTHLKAGSASIVLAASIGLLLGICLVLVHNIWVPESEVLVTLVAWFILIKSILWLTFPECMISLSNKVYMGPGYFVVALLAGILGIILLTHGFYLFEYSHVHVLVK